MQNKFLSNCLISTALVMEFSSTRLKNGVTKKILLQNRLITTVFVYKFMNLYQIPKFCNVSWSQRVIIFHGIDFSEKYYIVHH